MISPSPPDAHRRPGPALPGDAPAATIPSAALFPAPQVTAMSEFRIEKDSMGEVKVPAKAYYGAQTQRAVENFPISGQPLPKRLIRALGLVKWAAALANRDLGK